MPWTCENLIFGPSKMAIFYWTERLCFLWVELQRLHYSSIAFNSCVSFSKCNNKISCDRCHSFKAGYWSLTGARLTPFLVYFRSNFRQKSIRKIFEFMRFAMIMRKSIEPFLAKVYCTQKVYFHHENGRNGTQQLLLFYLHGLIWSQYFVVLGSERVEDY